MTDGTAGWQADPTGRFEHRYWDGSAWTDNVSNAGVMSTDPFEPSGAAAAGATGEPSPGQPAPPTDATAQQPVASSDPTAAWPATPAPPPPPTYVAPPPPGEAGGPPPPGDRSNRRVLIGGGILAVVAIVVAALLLGGDDGGDDDIRAKLASQLKDGSGLSQAQAECVADAVVDDLGADRFEGVDFSSDEPPPGLSEDLFDAAFDSFDKCNIDAADFGGSSDTSDTTDAVQPNGTTETTDDDILGGGSLPPGFEDQLAQIYEDSLGLPADKAACLAGKMADAVSSGDLTQDEAMSDVFSYLSDCDIELSEITGN